MNIQMMEGLMGASASARLSDTSMRVYRQASAEGDTETMKRALGYSGECTGQAAQYQEKLEKGIKAEVQAEREQAKLAQSSAAETRRETGRETEAGQQPARPRETDLVEISEAAQAALERASAGKRPQTDSVPAVYTPSGQTAPLLEPEPTVSCLA